MRVGAVLCIVSCIFYFVYFFFFLFILFVYFFFCFVLICFCQTFLQELPVVYVCCALLVCVCFVRVGAAFCIVSCIFYFVLLFFFSYLFV